jgi:hypothetical protein
MLGAELADLTADIPAEPNVAERAAEPAGTPGRTLARAARRAEICVLTALAFFGVVALTNAADVLAHRARARASRGILPLPGAG